MDGMGARREGEADRQRKKKKYQRFERNEVSGSGGKNSYRAQPLANPWLPDLAWQRGSIRSTGHPEARQSAL
jgi:hypothetical protein